MSKSQPLISRLKAIVGQPQVLVSAKAQYAYTKGMVVSDDNAAVLAVVVPKSLVQLWQVLQACAAADVILIAQAANTSLTGGSTPYGDYDRSVVMLSMRHLKGIFLLNEGKEVVALPAATLQELEHTLQPLGREPHSVLGSSCVGASVIGGVCNNSGGTLVQRGPAYTEMALYARLDESGQFELINELGIELGDAVSDPQTVLQRLESGDFADELVQPASDTAIANHDYQHRVRDCQSGTPARYNNDPAGLFGASGSSGKVIVFAVRLATFEQPKSVQTYYYSTNNPDALTMLRREWLSSDMPLPILAEYMHKDYNEVTFAYGVDTCFALNRLKADAIGRMYHWQSRLDFWLNRLRLPATLPDKAMQLASRWMPSPLSSALTRQAGAYQYHLIIRVADDAVTKVAPFLSRHLTHYGGALHHCTEAESDKLLNFRFAATAAMLRYHKLHQVNKNKVTSTKSSHASKSTSNDMTESTSENAFNNASSHTLKSTPKTASKDIWAFGDLISTDIALPRNSSRWDEKLPEDIKKDVAKTLYLGHFFCYVMHQDYLLKPHACEKEVKDKLLKFYDECAIKYPAEHNVGHIYTAHQELRQFYQHLDPTNSLNPGIGKTKKNKHWQ